MGHKAPTKRSGGMRKIGRTHKTTMGKSLVPRSKDTLISMQEANALRFYGSASVATARK